FAGILSALTSAGSATGLLFTASGFAPYGRSILRSIRDPVEVWRCTSDFFFKVIKPPFVDECIEDGNQSTRSSVSVIAPHQVTSGLLTTHPLRSCRASSSPISFTHSLSCSARLLR